MTKKQVVNSIYVTCWEFYKKYHARVPLSEQDRQEMLNETVEISERYGKTLFVRRLLHATCDELCEERENGDGRL